MGGGTANQGGGYQGKCTVGQIYRDGIPVGGGTPYQWEVSLHTREYIGVRNSPRHA